MPNGKRKTYRKLGPYLVNAEKAETVLASYVRELQNCEPSGAGHTRFIKHVARLKAKFSDLSGPCVVRLTAKQASTLDFALEREKPKLRLVKP